MEFEWDRKKAKYNLRKHGVSFEEASTVFSDILADVYDDPDHSAHESRFLMIGTSARGRLLNVAFANRKPRIRIITARAVTKREKRMYEEKNR